MVIFKDKSDRYAVIQPEHVSAITDGGNGAAIVHLRGGQSVAIMGDVLELWQLLSKRTGDASFLEKQSRPRPDPATVQTEDGEASADMDSGGAG